MTSESDINKMIALIDRAISGYSIDRDEIILGWTDPSMSNKLMQEGWTELRLWLADQDLILHDRGYKTKKLDRLKYSLEKISTLRAEIKSAVRKQ